MLLLDQTRSRRPLPCASAESTMSIAWYLAAFLTCSSRSVPPDIRVDVITSSDISDAFLNRMRAETEAIWSPAGVRFQWQRYAAAGAPCGRRLTVIIDNHEQFAAARGAALGWIIFKTNVPDPTIHLSLATADQLLLDLGGVGGKVVGTYEMLIARALGRALSHELGHYLLKSRVHTTRGLMRAVWPSPELFAPYLGGFVLTAAERADAAVRFGETR